MELFMLRKINNLLSTSLLLTTATLLLCGCGQTSNNKSESAPYDSSRIETEKKDKEQFLFNDTYKSDMKIDEENEKTTKEPFEKKEFGKGALAATITITHQGTVSELFKDTLRTIWNGLEHKGFVGFDSSLITKEKEFQFKSNTTQGYVDLSIPQHADSFSNMAVMSVLHPDVSFKYPSVFSFDDTDQYRKFDSDIKPLSYAKTLFGLKYQGRDLTVVKTDDGKYEAVLAKEFRPGAVNSGSFSVPPKIDSDIPVTQAQIDEWNQVFIDALKADPFFGKDEEASDFDPRKYGSYGNNADSPTDASGSASALAALKGKSGIAATSLMVNGVSGSRIDLGLPVYVQLKGSMDQGKSSDGMTGLVAYKLGNSVFGVVQSYANSGTGFTADSRHLESSIIAAHSFGLMFVEGQFGSISASDVNFKDWSGVRSQLRLGIDTPFGAPFIQLTYRDFGHTSDTAGYVGFEIANTEIKTDTYAFSTSLLTKVGHHSVHGATGSIDWTAALNLNSGVAFTTNLTLGSAAESKAAFNLSLDR